MARYERFTVLVNKKERQLIKDLAKKMDRSQGDAVRQAIKKSVEDLKVSADDNEDES